MISFLTAHADYFYFFSSIAIMICGAIVLTVQRYLDNRYRWRVIAFAIFAFSASFLVNTFYLLFPRIEILDILRHVAVATGFILFFVSFIFRHVTKRSLLIAYVLIGFSILPFFIYLAGYSSMLLVRMFLLVTALASLYLTFSYIEDLRIRIFLSLEIIGMVLPLFPELTRTCSAFLAAFSVLVTYFIIRYLKHQYLRVKTHGVTIEKVNWSELIILICFLLAVAGFFMTDAYGDFTRHNKTENLLSIATTIAATLDTESLSKLTGTPNDLKLPQYDSLIKRLNNVKKSQPSMDSILIFRVSNDSILNFLCTNNAWGYMIVFPGNTLGTATREQSLFFDTGLPYLSLPYKNRAGTWVSAVVPLVLSGPDEPYSPTVSLGLSVNFDAEIITDTISQSRFFAMTLLLLVFLLLTSFIAATIAETDHTLSSKLSELHYMSLFEGIPNPVFHLNERGEILTWNQSAENLVMGHPDVLETRKYCDIWPENLRKSACENFERSRKGEKTYFDGGWLADEYYSAILNPIIAESGPVEGCVAILVNMTTVKQAEDKLREKGVDLEKALDWKTALFENSMVGIAVFGMNMEIIDYNERFIQLIDGATFEGEDGTDIRTTMTRIMKSTLENGRVETNIIIPKKNGMTVVCDIATRELVSEGKPEGIIVTASDTTNLHTTLEQLSKQTGFLKSLINSLPDAVFFKDSAGRYIEGNPNFDKFIGISRDKYIGKADDDLFGPSEAEEYKKADRHIREEREELLFFYWKKFPDGSNHYTSTLKGPILDTNGNVIGIVGISRDITDIEMNRMELERINTLLKGLESALRGLLSAAEPDESVKACLMQIAKAAGAYSTALYESIDRNNDMVSEQFIRYAWSGMTDKEPVFKIDEAPTLETWFSKREMTGIASRLPFSTGSYPSRLLIPIFVNNRFWGILEIGHLMPRAWSETETRSLITAADSIGSAILRQRSEKLYRILAENTSDIIWVYNLDVNGYDYVSPSVMKLRGFTPAEALKQSLEESFNPDSFQFFSESIRKRITLYESGDRENAVHSIDEVLQPMKNGSFKNIEMTTTLMADENGRVTGILGVSRDISVRKEFENALKESTATANYLAIKAEEASEAKSSFLAFMSHEIRTPMNAIIGMANLLMQTELNREQKHFAELIKNSGHTLTALINDVLDITKIEADRIQIESIQFSLRDLVASVEEMFYYQALEKNIRLSAIVTARTPDNYVGDPTRIRQVLINLTGNAVKFTDTGRITICADRDPENARLQITIEDTGIGIPEEKQASLFKPFVQADSSITRKYGGTGLGLAISRRLIDKMGGEIFLESVPGKGTSFSVVLPLPAEDSSPVTKGIRILLAGEKKPETDALFNFLTWGGYSVTRYDDSETVPTETRFDMRIIDTPKPFEYIAQHTETEGLTVVIDGEMPRDYPGGEFSVGLLNRPFSGGKLLSAVAAVLEGKSLDAVTGEKQIVGKRYEGFSILVADDNIINREIITNMLAYHGIAVDCAVNGVEAVNLATTASYDLVFMDVQMPEMNGFEATREIRGKGVSIPVIALTAMSSNSTSEDCLKEGMSGYLRKPFEPEELSDVLEKWLVRKPVFSWDELLKRCMDNEKIARAMLANILKELPGMVEAVRTKHTDGNSPELTRAAHSIKGAAGMAAAYRLQEAAFALETASKQEKGEEVDGIGIKIKAVEKEADEFMKIIRERYTGG